MKSLSERLRSCAAWPTTSARILTSGTRRLLDTGMRPSSGALGAAWFAPWVTALMVSCVPPGDGVEPPADVLYFPVALTTNETHLFVVGSDFDLQYNHGAIHSLSLSRLRELAGRPCSTDADCQGESVCDVAPTLHNLGRPSFLCVASTGDNVGDPCRGLGFKTSSLRASAPGLCAPIDLDDPADGGGSVITDWVKFPAFATDAVLARRPSTETSGPTERLFVPSRGDSSLHWLDIEGGTFGCGQGEGRLCSDRFRVNENPEVIANPDTGDILKAPVDPYDLTASRDGRLLALTHQTDRAVSVYANDWAAGVKLAAVARSLSGSPVSIEAIPEAFSADSPELRTGFLMTFRDLAEVRLLRYFPDNTGALSGAGALRDAGRVAVRLNSPGIHSRGLFVDSSESANALEQCEAGDVACMLAARRIPRHLFIANRSPNSLLLGRMDPTVLTPDSPDLPLLFDSIPLSEGPTAVVPGHVMTAQGEVEPRLFVVCFDSNAIFVFNPKTGQLDTQLQTGRGPQSIAFDNFDPEKGEIHPLLYVGHFTDSYVGVISLDQRFPTTYGATLATIGRPTPPRAAK